MGFSVILCAAQALYVANIICCDIRPGSESLSGAVAAASKRFPLQRGCGMHACGTVRTCLTVITLNVVTARTVALTRPLFGACFRVTRTNCPQLTASTLTWAKAHALLAQGETEVVECE